MSTSELLEGKKYISPSAETTEGAVGKALNYSDKHTSFKIKNIKKNVLYGLTGSYLLAFLICLICDYIIFVKLSWSLIVGISLIGVWLLFLPFFIAKDRIVKKMLIILSLLIIPYLAILSFVLNIRLVLSLGACISIAAIVALWGVYGVFNKWENRKVLALGFAFLIGTVGQWGINFIVSIFIKNGTSDDLFYGALPLLFALICFGIDYGRRHLSVNTECVEEKKV